MGPGRLHPAREDVWAYKYVVRVGWSGGGALAVSYQAEAKNHGITRTPANHAADLEGAGLIPADAIIHQADHEPRAALLPGYGKIAKKHNRQQFVERGDLQA